MSNFEKPILILLQDQCSLVMQYYHIPNVSNKANTVLAVRIIIDQEVPSIQLSKQLIQDLDSSIALNRKICLSSERDTTIEIE